MTIEPELLKILDAMSTSPVQNYATPGLTSSLINNGKVRLFEAERATTEFITPHSHRFDFVCVVLEGSVENTIYTLAEYPASGAGELWAIGYITPKEDGMGQYSFAPGQCPQRLTSKTSIYTKGTTYAMTWAEVHSIKFGRGAKVLFFEGPERSTTSCVLEPWCNGARVPTFKTHEWMFKRED